MHDESMKERTAKSDVSVSKAHTRAMRLLWIDILVTCAILAVVASRL